MWPIPEGVRVADLLRPGLYRDCFLCDQDLEVVVRKVEYEPHGCYADSIDVVDEGFVVTPNVLRVRLIPGNTKDVKDFCDGRVTEYQHQLPRLLEEAEMRHKREEESLMQKFSGLALPVEDARLAAGAIADKNYAAYKPKSVEEMKKEYDKLFSLVTFQDLEKRARSLPRGEHGHLSGMHPAGLKAHFECVDTKFGFGANQYRALFTEGKCETVMKMYKILQVLAPRLHEYARQFQAYTQFSDNAVRIEAHRTHG